MSDRREVGWRARLWRAGGHPELKGELIKGPCPKDYCLGPWRKISDSFPMKKCRRCGRKS